MNAADELATDDFVEGWSAWISPAELDERDGERMRQLLAEFAAAVRAKELGRIARRATALRRRFCRDAEAGHSTDPNRCHVCDQFIALAQDTS